MPEHPEAAPALLELTLGAPAAGGGFVARAEDGRVIFVRHGLPGERVLAELTESHSRWARADAVEVLEASPDRVKPPCRFAGRGRCGGCDYQHASLAAQRRFKALLLEEQLRRVAKIERTVRVEPFSETGLGTRTRIRFGVTDTGALGMRRRASNDLIELDTCLLGVDQIASADLASMDFPPGHDVQVVALNGATEPSIALVEWTEDELDPSEITGDLGDDDVSMRTTVGATTYQVSAGSFFQIHRRAPEVLIDAVLAGLDLAPGDHVLDLYAGVGLLTVPIARAVGADGVVIAVESSPDAVADAEVNLASFTQAQVVEASVTAPALEELLGGAGAAVIDPPRSGIDRGALEALIDEPTLTRVVLVSCSPATFSRDLKVLLDAGFELGTLRALDLFEMTEHLEIIASLRR